MLYGDLLNWVIRMLHNSGYPPVTEAGEESRFYLVMSPLRNFGLVRREMVEGRRWIYKISDGGLYHLDDRKKRLREWIDARNGY